MGELRGEHVVIQRQRVRDSLDRVDPIGRQKRKRKRLKRRKYSVPCPNFMW